MQYTTPKGAQRFVLGEDDTHPEIVVTRAGAGDITITTRYEDGIPVISVTLEDAAVFILERDGERQQSFKKEAPVLEATLEITYVSEDCPSCESFAEEGLPRGTVRSGDGIAVCPACKGTGERPSDEVESVVLVCPHCQSTGSICERDTAERLNKIFEAEVKDGKLINVVFDQDDDFPAWEGTDFVCISCDKEVELPDRPDVNYTY